MRPNPQFHADLVNFTEKILNVKLHFCIMITEIKINKSILQLEKVSFLTFSWRKPLSYRNQSIDLLRKSMDWFLYHNGLRHEKVKSNHGEIIPKVQKKSLYRKSVVVKIHLPYM